MKRVMEEAIGLSRVMMRMGMMSRRDWRERFSRMSRMQEKDEPGSMRARRRRAAWELPSLTMRGMRPASRERQLTMARESLYLMALRVMQWEGVSMGSGGLVVSTDARHDGTPYSRGGAIVDTVAHSGAPRWGGAWTPPSRLTSVGRVAWVM